MKTTFRPNINLKRKKRRILTGALITLVLLIIVFHDFSFRLVHRPLFYVLQPFLKAKRNIDNWWQKTKTDFSEKQSLFDENKILRERVAELEIKIILLENLGKENAVLKAAFSAEDLKQWALNPNKQKFILGAIISRPPMTPFDILLIDAGAEEGIKEGMPVSAFGNVLLGYVEEIFPTTSKVKLISSFGEETNALLESSATPGIAIGRGGENFEITLPRAISVEIGEKIITLGKQPLLIGIVEKIERQITDPFQKIMFRLPVNIHQLRQVFVLRK